MFRKLIVVVCLLTFTPIAVGAQELAGLAAPVASAQTAAIPNKDLNLAASTEKVIREKQDALAIKGEEPAQSKTSGLTMGEWADIHFSNYRWVWWLGGAIVLGALHAVAISKN